QDRGHGAVLLPAAPAAVPRQPAGGRGHRRVPRRPGVDRGGRGVPGPAAGVVRAMSEDGARRVCLHQPNFLPWTKLVDKLLASDIYIAYDSVQYTHSEFHARQWISGRDGPVWLSVPVLTRGRSRQPLYKAELVPGRAWRDAHLRLLT